MQIATEGTVGLIRQPAQERPLMQFCRRHRDLLDDAQCLLTQVETVPALCQRFLSYLSTDLHWISRSGVEPVAFEALAEGLISYREARIRQFAVRPFSTSVASYQAFLETILKQAASRLCLVTLTSESGTWSPAAGLPLQPWLATQPACIAISPRPFNGEHAGRVRQALGDFVLSAHERQQLGIAAFKPSVWPATERGRYPKP